MRDRYFDFIERHPWLILIASLLFIGLSLGGALGRVDAAIRSLGALLDALNDGSFVPGENYTADQIETKIKAQL